MSSSQNYHLVPTSVNDEPNAHYNLSMLYCGFFVVATAGLILAIYQCIALNWCTDYPSTWPRESEMNQKLNVQKAKLTELHTSVFKYKGGGSCEECVVCLCEYEEGEDVRELVKCKHSFHAPCIDMWLYSHFDCPLCRAPVAVVAVLDAQHGDIVQSENLDSGLSDDSVVQEV